MKKLPSILIFSILFLTVISCNYESQAEKDSKKALENFNKVTKETDSILQENELHIKENEKKLEEMKANQKKKSAI